LGIILGYSGAGKGDIYTIGIILIKPKDFPYFYFYQSTIKYEYVKKMNN
jgi:hypothetical protein